MPKLVRIITYTGPQAWLDMCVDNGFVALRQILGNDGKSITSQWRDPKAQPRAQQIDDHKRKGFYMSCKPGQAPRPRNSVLDAPERLEEAYALLEEYRSQHEYCNDETQGSTAPQAQDRRCAICKAVDELENHNG